MTDWKYGIRHVGPCDTRHEAIGAAVVSGSGGRYNTRWDLSVYAARASDLCSAVDGFVECVTRNRPGDETACLWCEEKIGEMACSRCGDDRPLREVIVHGPREDPDEVVCPDCAESEDRIVTDGGRAGDGAGVEADCGPHP